MGELFGSPHYDVKQKLTIGLSKEVIDRAKAARINISAVTEQVLRALTYEPAGYSNDDVADAYDKLFKSMLPVLDKYGAFDVMVGQHTNYSDMAGEFPIILDGQSTVAHPELLIWSPDFLEVEASISITEALPYLYDPLTILEDLMESLIRAAEVNKNKLQTFKFASRFLKMLSEDEEQPSSAKHFESTNTTQM